MAIFGNALDMSGVKWECLAISKGVQGVLQGAWGLWGDVFGSLISYPFNFLQFQEVTEQIFDIFQ